MAAAQRFLRPANRPTPDSFDLDVVNFKVKGKDIQAGIVEWEQLASALTKDHAITLDAKLLRAFLMNIMPKWMYDKIVEHLDRLHTYVQVRER